jgi:hypothetical protein
MSATNPTIRNVALLSNSLLREFDTPGPRYTS